MKKDIPMTVSYQEQLAHQIKEMQESKLSTAKEYALKFVTSGKPEDKDTAMRFNTEAEQWEQMANMLKNFRANYCTGD